MNVLVTGGAGFIGSHICERLLTDGHKVYIFDNFSTGKDENVQFLKDFVKSNNISVNNLDVIRGDIRDRGDLKLAFKDIDIIFHEAADPAVQKSIEDPLTFHEINCEGTLNVLEEAKQNMVRKVIFASSCAVYGDDPSLPKSEQKSSTLPISPYGADKLCSEHYCQLYSRLYGLDTVILRYFNVFGPRQDPGSYYSGVISIFIDRFKNDKAPVIYGDGKQSRDFIFIKDIVNANMLAYKANNVSGEIFNVSCGRKTDLNSLIALLNNITGKDITPEYEAFRKGDIKESVADISKISSLLDFSSEYTLESALRETYKSF